MIGRDCPMSVRFSARNRCYTGKKNLLDSLAVISSAEVCTAGTMPVRVTDVLTTTWPMRTDHGASLTSPITTGLSRLTE